MFSARTTLLLLALPAVALAWAPAPFKPPIHNMSGWPGWRGPERTGVSREKGLLRSWPLAGPKLLWKVSDLGAGYSTPSVTGGRVYVLGMRAGKEHVFALDAAKDGKQLWTTEIGTSVKTSSPAAPGPRSTVTVDGERLYALGSLGDLLCLDLAGKVIWRKNLVKDFQGSSGPWGYAESPLVDGNLLVCTPGSPTATMVGLDKKTGAAVWKAAVAKGNKAAYASPIVAEVGRIRHYVQFLSGCVVGVSARDGKVLWTYEGLSGTVHAVTPVFHDGHVFVTTIGAGKKGGGVLLELTAANNGVQAREVYHISTLASQYGGVVCVGGCLYGSNASALMCIDFKTGKTKWQNASVGKCSVLAADGQLYVRGDKGPIALVEASTALYKENGRFTPPNQSRFASRAHPVVADGRLYLRDQEMLLCYDVRKP